MAKSKDIPMYVQRWVPADYVNDEFVRGLYLRRDYRTAAFYPVFLFYSHLKGGTLPSPIGHLASILLMPPRDVEHALKVCMDAGKIQEEGGRLFHKRVKDEVTEFEAYRRSASESGKRGAQARINKDSPRVPIGDPKLEPGGAEVGGGGVEPGGGGAPSAAPPTRQGPPGELETVQTETQRELDTTARVTGIPTDELLALHGRAPNGAQIVSISNCDSVAWLRTLGNKLRERRFAFEANARAGPPPGKPRTVGDQNMAGFERFKARRESDGADPEGKGVRGGALQAGDVVPPGAGRPDR